MGALNIAFDTTIVGALALSWVVLVIHLFFLNDEARIEDVTAWINQQGLSTVAGVLLFAMTYALGSGVSRIAEDFFNDDDLRIEIGNSRLRMGVTEDGIQTRVYCENDELLAASTDKIIAQMHALMANSWVCQHALEWLLPAPSAAEEEKKELASHIFYLQQSALQLNGEDKTERLRQLHDQVFVLRGAAFNGLVAFLLCLFALGSGLHSKLRWAIPLIVLIPALIAVIHHFQERPLSDPPFMEFILLLLGFSGGYLLWKGAHLEKIPPEKQTQPRKIPAGLLVLSFLFTFVAFLAWWSTETLYSQQIMNTYYAQAQQLPR